MPGDRPTISTHVLDTGSGQPAAGVRVICLLLDGDRVQAAGGGVTDDDGRIRDVLGGPRSSSPGVYRLSFELGAARFFEAVHGRRPDRGRRAAATTSRCSWRRTG